MLISHNVMQVYQSIQNYNRFTRERTYCQAHGIVYTELRIALVICKKMLRLFQCTQFMQGYFIPIENYIALHQFDQVCKYIFSQYYSLFICSHLGSEINLFHVQKIKGRLFVVDLFVSEAKPL